MQRHKEPYLPVINPLPDTVPCALLNSRHQRAIVNNAVEDLPACTRGWARAVL